MLTEHKKPAIQKAGAVNGPCLSLYKGGKTSKEQYRKEHEKITRSRVQLIEWTIFEDYGSTVASKKHYTGSGMPPFNLHTMM